MRVFITGGAGFIGSHLTRYLWKRYPDCYIVVADKLDYCSSLRSLQDLLPSEITPNDSISTRPVSLFHLIQVDISDFEKVYKLLQVHEIDVILHLAASTHVDNSFGDSFDFTKNNVLGTHVLLEAARQYGRISRFIHVSTDEVYGETVNSKPSMEESVLAPSNPYAATKAAAECMVKAYAVSFHLPVIITRSNNVYGPAQYPEKIIPKFICRLLEAKSCFVHGDGSHSRRYLYVSDVVHALDIILHRGKIGEVYNIGTSVEVTNLDLARLLISKLQGEVHPEKWITFVRDRAYNDRRYAIDSTKILELGWQEQVSFEDGIHLTIDWYRKYGKDWWSDTSCIHVPHGSRRMATEIGKDD